MHHALAGVLLMLSVPVSAQITGSGGILYGQTKPVTCSKGDVFASTSGGTLSVCTALNTWTDLATNAGSGVPTGASILIETGTCPAGYTENTALNGKALIGTLAANGNVGQSVGSDTITDVVNHTHAVTITDPGHTHPEGYRNTGTAGTAGVQGASTANNASIANGVLSATTGITATSVNPVGGVASIDNRQASIYVIVCKKS